MMRIESVDARPDRVGRHLVRLEDGTSMRLYPQTIQDHGLYPGLELTDQQMENLRLDAGKMSAKMRAVRIVTASSVSKGDLQRRLVQKGEDPEQARQAVAWMEELDLVDDRKTAEQVVGACIRKGYGLSRAKQALYEKRIPKSYWQDALADYPDQLDAIVEFLTARLGDNRDERELRRATEALMRRGHSYGDIRRGLQQLSMNDDFLEE